MESSPLAAMHQPSLMSRWGGRNDMYTSHPHAHIAVGGNNFGPGAFDFRDLSLKQSSKPDYFQMRPVRGSSPTASLAADLSQNFHIDMSPQLPTPRRSLFTSNLFGTIDGRECVTTPPIPSSSPGPLDERMDISPLPHKQPYHTLMQVQSPSPQPQDTDMEMLQSSPPRPVETPRPGVERRKSILVRPSLARTKGLTTSNLGSSALGPWSADGQLPPFKFGIGSSKLCTSTSMSLDECFGESPVQERRPQSANSPSASALMGFPRVSKPFGSMSSFRNGSPIGNHNRRTSNPMFRPRKQFRRSLSMFENPGDVMKPKGETVQSSLNTVVDMEEPLHQPVLPHFFQEGQPDSIPRITKDTLLEVLGGQYDRDFDQRLIIDCRFEYEFEGGHINGAVNYNDKEHLASQLFEQGPAGKMLLIFHCEYSAHRAPIMARHIRKHDRSINAECYPKLTYPEVYILDGGYSNFFKEHRDRCYPQNYVEMDDKAHAYTCEREMGKLRQNRAKLGRSQTFAFGQHSMEDSPTAPNRSRTTDDDITFNSMGSPMLGHDRGKSLGSPMPRRLVSF